MNQSVRFFYEVYKSGCHNEMDEYVQGGQQWFWYWEKLFEAAFDFVMNAWGDARSRIYAVHCEKTYI